MSNSFDDLYVTTVIQTKPIPNTDKTLSRLQNHSEVDKFREMRTSA